MKYGSSNYPSEILQIVYNEFQVNIMNKSGKFWRWPQKEDKIFYTSNNIIKCIEPPQVAGLRSQFEFYQIWLNDHLLLHKLLLYIFYFYFDCFIR